MVQFKIKLNSSFNPVLYENYCRFIFESIVRSVDRSANRRKYKVREKYVIESGLIKWVGTPPKTINLLELVKQSLVLERDNGDYYVRLSPYKYVPGSKTKLSFLVRLLEYGNEEIPPYPLIRTVFEYYSKNYTRMVVKFMKARMTKRESVPLRKVFDRTTEVSFGRQQSSYH